MTKIQCAAGQYELKALVKFKTVGSQAIVRTMVRKLSVNGSPNPQIQMFKEGSLYTLRNICAVRTHQHP